MTSSPPVSSSRRSLLALVVAGSASILFGAGEARADNAECVRGFEQGTTAREHGKLRDARRHFVSCAADSCSKTLRIDCAKALDDVDASLPTVVFGAKDERGADLFDVSVFVDGERVIGHDQGKALPFDPGPHVVRFERAGAKPVEEKVLLRSGERNRPVIAKFGEERERRTTAKANEPKEAEEPPPVKPASASSTPVGALVLGGIGLGAVASFVYFGLSGSQEKDRLQTACAPGCTNDDVSTLRTQYIAADVSLGIGIVALGLATYLLLTHDSSPAAAGSQPGRFARTIWK